MYYYHLSQIPDLKTLIPKIPSNDMVNHFGENGTIPRICVARHIDECLTALNGTLDKNKPIYVYMVICDNVYEPSSKLVPDKRKSRELWILEETVCSLIYVLSKPKINEEESKP